MPEQPVKKMYLEGKDGSRIEGTPSEGGVRGDRAKYGVAGVKLKKKRARKKVAKKKRKRRLKKWKPRTESTILKACLHWLQANGVYAWRNNTGALPDGAGRFIRYGHIGSPDIIGWTKSGRWFGVECKVRGNEQSPAQVAFQQAAEEDDALYILVYGVIDLENYRKELTKQSLMHNHDILV
jgi:hypothetical protein